MGVPILVLEINCNFLRPIKAISCNLGGGEMEALTPIHAYDLNQG